MLKSLCFDKKNDPFFVRFVRAVFAQCRRGVGADGYGRLRGGYGAVTGGVGADGYGRLRAVTGGYGAIW
jgi:hypothetical protein